MWVKFRHKVFFVLFRPIVYLIFRIKYGFRTKKYKMEKGPHLILFNHPSNFDPIFAGVSFNRPIYFIANEDLFNIPVASKILNYLVAPIPKQKSVRDLSTIKTSLKIVKEGGSIGVAPEGNRTYSGKLNSIDFSIVKFIKFLKIPVVLYTIKGGFGVNPRFATKTRKGKIYGSVEQILTKEEVLSLSQEELYEIIIKGLDVDDTTLGLKYKGKNLAEYMESVFYICPVCEQMHTIYSEGDFIKCSNCKLEVEYTPELLFKTNDKRFKFTTPREYYEFQDNYIRNFDIDNLSYDNEIISLYDASMGRKKQFVLSGKITLNINGLKIESEHDSIEFKISDIISLSILYHNTLIVNLDGMKYHISGSDRFNGLKYLHLFTLLKNKEQGVENGFLGI